jgi:hypothetical protein
LAKQSRNLRYPKSIHSTTHVAFQIPATMNKFFRILILAFWSVVATPAEAAPPSVTAQKVAKMADDYLKERGLLNSTYIVSITMENSVLFGAPQYWFVKWDKPLPVDGSKKKEIGLKVTFDGKLSRLVD